MSSYGEPDPQHRNAVAQINDARQRALRAVSEMRQVHISTPHPNLAPTPGDGEQSLPIMCSQAVVDYLLQLRPYRQNSQNWHIDFGTIKLPTTVEGSGSGRRMGGSESRPNLRINRDPSIPVSNATELISAVNHTVRYSLYRPSERRGRKSQVKVFKIVFPADGLLKIVEAADEIAAEMDMLAELSEPDYGAGGGDAV